MMVAEAFFALLAVSAMSFAVALFSAIASLLMPESGKRSNAIFAFLISGLLSAATFAVAWHISANSG